MKTPRVLIGLSEVAGHYRGLKEGFETLGVPCTFLNFSEHPFGFQNDDDIWPVRVIQRVDTQRRQTSGAWFWVLIFWQACLQSILFFRVLFKHDIFIYCANRNFVGFVDLFILRLMGKKIIYQMHGSDSRAPYFDGSYEGGDLLPLRQLVRLTRFKRLILWITECGANVLVNIPPQAHLCRKRYINWLYVGLSCCPPGANQSSPIQSPTSDASGPFRIVHSPSNPGAKGTPEIRAAIQRLKEKGVDVEYIELTGVANDKVIEEIRRADLVIDQMYSDYSMPGFATEAAWCAKPVLTAGYAVDHWAGWMHEEDIPPTCFCLPHQFDIKLYELATDADKRASVGSDMYHFVSTRWRPEQVAQNYLTCLQDPPAEWWLDPKDNEYVGGCGISQNKLRERLTELLDTYGEKVLGIADKPLTLDRIRQFTSLSK